MSVYHTIKSSTRYLALIALTASLSSPTLAADDKKKKKKRKTQVMSPKVGKKVQKAFDAYAEERLDDAIEMLEKIKPSKEFDKAFVNRLLGNMYAGKEGQMKKAIKLLTAAAAPDILNPNEQAATLKLLANLNLGSSNFKAALKGYQDWMAFTGKEDSDIYTRIAQCYYQLKQLDKIIAPADKAIKLMKKLTSAPYQMKITSYYERKKYPQAAQVTEELVKLFPEDKKWWIQLAQFYMLSEDYKKALYTFDLAYKQGHLGKDNQYTALTQLLSANGVPHKAAVLQEKFIKEGLVEKNEKSIATLANFHHQARNFKKAAKQYTVLAGMTKDPEYNKKSGDLLLLSEDYKGSIVAYKKAITGGSKDKDAITMSLVESYFYSADYKNAYKSAKAAAKVKKYRKIAPGWLSYIKDTAKRKNVKI